MTDRQTVKLRYLVLSLFSRGICSRIPFQTRKACLAKACQEDLMEELERERRDLSLLVLSTRI